MIRHLFLLFLLISAAASGQTVFTNNFLATETKSVVKINKENDSSFFYLPARFANAPIDTSGLAKWKSKYNTIEISLVYTKFKESPTFNQRQLNAQRISNFLKYNPDINEHSFIKLNLIEQTGCNKKEEGLDYFHGFILKGSIRPNSATVQKEIDQIKTYLLNTIPDYTGSPPTNGSEIDTTTSSTTARDPKKYRCPDFPGGANPLRSFIERNMQQPNQMNEYLYQGYVEMYCYLTERGEIKTIEITKTPGKWQWMEDEAIRLVKSMPVWEPAKYNDVVEASFVKLSVYFGKSQMPTLVDCEKPKNAELEVKKNDEGFEIDNIVSSVLNRNSNWKQMLIVCDITGSMSSYNADMLMWIYYALQKDTTKIEAISFFNDGDQKNDNKKKIGKTGGIYTSTSKDFKTIIELMESAMHNGNGGDLPENNIEAIINSCAQFPKTNEVIMIADNLATPRDLSLLYQVKVPVRIILCATNGRINPEYLNIARSTKGSVHFKDLDVTDLHTLQEGEVFELLGNSFMLSAGTIIYAR